MGEAKRRGSLEERIEQSKQNELHRREQEERDAVLRRIERKGQRKATLMKIEGEHGKGVVMGGRAGGARGMMMVAAALTIGANSGMMGRHN